MSVSQAVARKEETPVSPARRPASLLRASCWLALLLIAAKAAIWSSRGWDNAARRFLELLMSTWTDVLFALVCGVAGSLAVLALSKWPRIAAAGRVLFIGFLTLCAFYAVAAAGLFRYFNRPATFELFGLVGNATVVRSSIMERMTVPTALALIFVPLAFLILASRRGRRRQTTPIAVALAMAWILSGWAFHRAQWREDRITHIWLSPHVELLRTTVNHLAGGKRPKFPKNFPPEDMDEFRTFGARGVTRLGTFRPPADVTRPKNVIVIVLESVGAKYLRLYGNPLDVMPSLTTEARHALVFDNIYAHASFTYCSFRTLHFSAYPGLPWHYALLAGSVRPLPGTLASALRARGIRTAYFNNGDLDWEDQRWLLERSAGFETMDDYSKLGCARLSSWGVEDRCIFDRLLQWIDEKPGQPFFAFCWTDQSHDPYLLGPGVVPIDFFGAKAPELFARDLSAYLNVLHETDRHIGRMFAALRERGLGDDTLVVVTGDHGEAFADPHRQRGHAWSVFEEEVRVPLLIWNPRLFPDGGRSPVVGGHVDLNPTLADILEVEPEKEWQGHSLFDPRRPERAFFLAIAGGDVFGVREGDWKYAYDVTSGDESLFNLRIDSREQQNVVAQEPERAARLRERVAAWVTFEEAFLRGRKD